MKNTEHKHADGSVLVRLYRAVDPFIVRWMATYGLTILRIVLGVLFFWFGALKLLPGMSPEEELVTNTVYFVDPAVFLPILAIWECVIGVGLIIGRFMRFILLLLFIQMAGTALPLVVRPDVVWTQFPYGLTLEGQYIVKNLVLLAAGIVLGGTVRGGRIDPQC